MTDEELQKIKEHIYMRSRIEPYATEIIRILKKAVEELEATKELQINLDELRRQRQECERQYQEKVDDIIELQKENEDLRADVQSRLNVEVENIELKKQIEKMKKYIKACWVEENLNDYSSYITNTSDEFIDLVKELNAEVRNGRKKNDRTN